jgi:undecaprenyl-diphosphatase
MWLSVGTAQVMKYVFSRERPSATNDPNQWFKGSGNQSFPSGEVAEIAGAVTPFIAAYGADHPQVYGLILLPVYDAIARVKVRGHWQSDVLVGGALGAGFGIYAARSEHPFFLSILPSGMMVGFKKEF